jgi:hypothetical protein
MNVRQPQNKSIRRLFELLSKQSEPNRALQIHALNLEEQTKAPYSRTIVNQFLLKIDIFYTTSEESCFGPRVRGERDVSPVVGGAREEGPGRCSGPLPRRATCT